MRKKIDKINILSLTWLWVKLTAQLVSESVGVFLSCGLGNFGYLGRCWMKELTVVKEHENYFVIIIVIC